jgi:hypothetical protein
VQLLHWQFSTVLPDGVCFGLPIAWTDIFRHITQSNRRVACRTACVMLESREINWRNVSCLQESVLVIFVTKNSAHRRNVLTLLFLILLKLWLGYGLDGPGFESPHMKEDFSSPERADQLWGPPSIVCALSRSKVAGAWSWPVPRLSQTGDIPAFPLYTFMRCAGTYCDFTFRSRKRAFPRTFQTKSCNFQCHIHFISQESTVRAQVLRHVYQMHLPVLMSCATDRPNWTLQ